MIMGFAVISLGTARADITFSFDYGGSTEFNDPTLGSQRRAALEDAAATLGSWFVDAATINVDVSSYSTNNGTLATAGSAFPSTGVQGFTNRGITMGKVLGLGDANGSLADATVSVNFYYNYSLGDSVGGGEYDFKSIIMHELMHTLGFSAQIREDGSDLAGQPAGSVGYWTPFDAFVGDNTGVLIGGTTFQLDGSRWNAAKEGGTSGGLFYYGANGVAANGGNPIYLYSPSPYDSGSSVSHLDGDFYTSQAYLMEPNILQGSLGPRALSGVEVGMLTDLGYNVSVPEPTVALYGMLAAGLVLMRRRRGVGW